MSYSPGSELQPWASMHLMIRSILQLQQLLCRLCRLCLLQVWHLRSGSSHPCAQQLSAAMAGLPQGAKVLLVLGEIDCREGLLMSVEKMKVSL